MNTILGCDPKRSVPSGGQAINSLEASAEQEPIATIKFPNLVRRGAANPTVRRFDKPDDLLGSELIRGGKDPPGILVSPRDLVFGAQPRVTVSRDQCGPPVILLCRCLGRPGG